jgi:hypothetical protein
MKLCCGRFIDVVSLIDRVAPTFSVIFPAQSSRFPTLWNDTTQGGFVLVVQSDQVIFNRVLPRADFIQAVNSLPENIQMLEQRLLSSISNGVLFQPDPSNLLTLQITRLLFGTLTF